MYANQLKLDIRRIWAMRNFHLFLSPHNFIGCRCERTHIFSLIWQSKSLMKIFRLQVFRPMKGEKLFHSV